MTYPRKPDDSMARLEHVGFAVSDGHEASATLARLFGSRPYKTELVEREGVQTIFIDAGGPKFELLESRSDTSAVARFLEKRGEGLHHIAVEVDDIDAEMDRVRKAGFTVLSDSPLEGADGKLVFFVHPRDCHGVLVEFCSQARPTWIRSEFERAGRNLTVRTAGSPEARPVVLLYTASTHEREVERMLLPVLERCVHLIALDVDGIAPVAKVEGDRPNPLAEAVLNILDHLDVSTPATTVAFEAASRAALHLAQTCPSRIGGLVLIDPAFDELEPMLLDDALPAVGQVLFCSLARSSRQSVLRLCDRFPASALSIIPSFDGNWTQLAEQIAALSTWN
jgi:methylmalonyl-CoA epimerase